jgi:hypothetical protein
MEDMKLSAPWITFVHELEALFSEDLEVKVKYDETNNTVKLYVADSDKAMALEKLIPAKKDFGNVSIAISVIPPNVEEMTKEDLFNKAFRGNPAVSFTASYDNPLGHLTYIVFEKKVVQFFNDQLDDINGNKSMLFQEIAYDVFGSDHAVFYCTDADRNLSKPLGEWP